MHRDEGEQAVIRFPLQLDDQVRVLHPSTASILHGPPKGTACNFCNYLILESNEPQLSVIFKLLGLIHRQDLFDSLCLLLIMKDDTAFPLSWVHFSFSLEFFNL
ncbi:hypothetical protein V6N13_098196 [Hibiscus sabdariffa]|uniref:Uncharacterized protein n=1 Tax=Hibiscus sabdariffa TaxID=183260 RepID=A0ABR2ED23_9ROSI